MGDFDDRARSRLLADAAAGPGKDQRNYLVLEGGENARERAGTEPGRAKSVSVVVHFYTADGGVVRLRDLVPVLGPGGFSKPIAPE